MPAAPAGFGLPVGYIDVKRDFLARGDGTTDDTAAIQAAINAAAAAGPGGGVVYIPSGTYIISATLTLQQGVELHGAGWRPTGLAFSAAGGTSDVIASVGSSTYTDRMGIFDLMIINSGTGQFRHGINLTNCGQVPVQRVFVLQPAATGSCIYVNNAFFVHIDKCYLDANNVGTGITFTAAANANYVTGTQIYNAGVYGVDVESSAVCSLRDVLFEYGKSTATLLNIQSASGFRADNVAVADNNNHSQPCAVGGTSGAHSQAVTFTGCSFSNSGAYGVTATYTDGLVFENCRWVANTSGGVILNTGVTAAQARAGYIDSGSIFTNGTASEERTLLDAPGNLGQLVLPTPTATLNGTTSGTAVMAEDCAGTIRRVVVYLNGYENASAASQTMAYPNGFPNQGAITYQPSAFGATTTTTTLTLPNSMSGAVTGIIVIEGM